MAEIDTTQQTDLVSKLPLPFTAEAVPGYEDSNVDSTGPHDLDDSYKPIGPPATRKEVWSYYAYYAGNNGIGSFQ